MRIVIDMQGAQTESRFRGIGRYTMALTRAMVINRGKHEIMLALNGLFPETIEPIRAEFDGLLPQENILVWYAPGPVRESSPGNEWRRQVAERIREAFLVGLRPDVILISSLFEGYVDDAVTSIGVFDQTIPIFVILYDLIPLLNPEQYLKSNQAFKQYYLNKIEHLKRAGRWLCISDSTATGAWEVLGLKKKYTVNISAACDEKFIKIEIPQKEEMALRKRYHLNQPFILYTGGSDFRKNLHGLIRAYAGLSQGLRDRHQLVLAGKMPDGDVWALEETAKAARLQKKQLIFTGYVTDEELVQLYNLCKLFVFPSCQEGFGLPVLEAMSCGAPLICGNTSSLPEVICYDEAMFDPLLEDQISKKMTQGLTDSEFRTELIQHGKTQTKKFSWKNSAIRAIAVFEEMQKNKGISSKSRFSFKRQREIDYRSLINSLASLPHVPTAPGDDDLVECACCIDQSFFRSQNITVHVELPEKLVWRIEGPFDSSYSLALLNRETARAIKNLGHVVALHSTEGPGDFAPDKDFLTKNPDLARMHDKSLEITQEQADVVSRILYPPRVADMRGSLNLLHHYAWEETGFPQQWVEAFNRHLDGMTCLSNHVEKIMIDNGVTIPLSVSGCGVDHWELIVPDYSFKVKARSFRFLHVSSCFPRKGVDILIHAYGEAFSNNDDVTLIIKTFCNPHNEIQRWLAEAIENNNDFPDVLVIEEELTDAQLKALYKQCQVLVAPSRAEGFGLPIAEAMLSGLAVITTAWSGQLDFCNEETAWLIDYSFEAAETHFNLFDSVWASPSVETLSKTMISVYEMDDGSRAKQAQKGKDWLLADFKWTDVASRLIASARTFAKAKKCLSPKIGWVSTWNTRCGIAAYSEHLIKNMPVEITILSQYSQDQTRKDTSNVIRCWGTNQSENLNALSKVINEQDIDTLVIQFNYGFFNFDHFIPFLQNQIDAGRCVIITFHSTSDPLHVDSEKRLEKLAGPLRCCHRLLVHTVADMNRLKAIGIIDNVTLFPHGIVDYDPADKVFPSKKNRFTIASYGFFLPQKGLLELIQAVRILREKGLDVRLRMVNAEYPIPDSRILIKQAENKIKHLNLGPYVEMVTDFLEDKQSLSLLSDTDLIVFPYKPGTESSSAAVRYGIATGQAVAVTPMEIFDDVAPAVFYLPGHNPDEIARGVEQLLDEFANNTPLAQVKAENAQRWRCAHRYSKLGQRLYNMLFALFNKQKKSTIAH